MSDAERFAAVDEEERQMMLPLPEVIHFYDECQPGRSVRFLYTAPSMKYRESHKPAVHWQLSTGFLNEATRRDA